LPVKIRKLQILGNYQNFPWAENYEIKTSHIPAGGGRMFELSKTSSGGGLNVQLKFHPHLKKLYD